MGTVINPISKDELTKFQEKRRDHARIVPKDKRGQKRKMDRKNAANATKTMPSKSVIKI